jgi:hypothetical protein
MQLELLKPELVQQEQGAEHHRDLRQRPHPSPEQAQAQLEQARASGKSRRCARPRPATA